MIRYILGAPLALLFLILTGLGFVLAGLAVLALPKVKP